MESDELAISIGKRNGTIKLGIIDSIPEVSIVEGDSPNSWVICVNHPFRKLQYGKELPEWDTVKQLRKVKQHYDRLSRQLEYEINWIKGESNDKSIQN